MRPGWAFVSLVGALLLISAAEAQNTAPPVPAQIVAARSVFVANGGETCTWFTGPNRAYRDLYTALQRWGRYQLATAPGAADLIFSVSFSCPATAGEVVNGTSTGPVYSPQLKLRILTPNTQALLWTIVEPVRMPILPSHAEQNFERGIQALVGDLQHLGATLPAAPQPPTVRRHENLGLILSVAGAVGGLVIFLIARHHMQAAFQQTLPTPPAFAPR